MIVKYRNTASMRQRSNNIITDDYDSPEMIRSIRRLPFKYCDLATLVLQAGKSQLYRKVCNF